MDLFDDGLAGDSFGIFRGLFGRDFLGHRIFGDRRFRNGGRGRRLDLGGRDRDGLGRFFAFKFGFYRFVFVFLFIRVFGPVFGIFRHVGCGLLRGAGCRVEGFEFVVLAAARIGFLLGEQRHAVGDGDLIIVGMDFRKGEEALPVAAIFDERGLQRRLYARHLGEIDVAFEGPLGGGFEIKFFDFLSVENDHPGLFRVACIDKHTLGHRCLRAARSRTSQRRAGRGTGSRGMGRALFGAGAMPQAVRP